MILTLIYIDIVAAKFLNINANRQVVIEEDDGLSFLSFNDGLANLAAYPNKSLV